MKLTEADIEDFKLRLRQLESEIESRATFETAARAIALLSPMVGKLLAERDEQAAEIKRLREALTPSGDTKHEYIGEVSQPCSNVSYPLEETITWTATKEIMQMILARADSQPPDVSLGNQPNAATGQVFTMPEEKKQ